MDLYEGVSAGCYRKEILSIMMDGQSSPCLVYVDPEEEEGVPLAEYVDRINNGLQDAVISAAYSARYVRKFVPIQVD